MLNLRKKLRDGSMPFLDMKVKLKEGKITTSGHQKSTSTRLIPQFRVLALMVHRKNITEATKYRIINSMPTWDKFVESMDSAMKIWEANQYTPKLYQPLIRATLDKILNSRAKPLSEQPKPTNTHHAYSAVQGKREQTLLDDTPENNQCVRDLHHSKDEKGTALPQSTRPKNVAE